MRLLLIAAVIGQAACVKTILADTLSAPGNLYSRDDDPELVRDSLPILLKLMEQLHDSLPRHKALSVALTRGFASYGAAFIEEEADRLHETNVDAARTLYARAKRMFLRARGYGLDGLEAVAPGFRLELARDRKAALARIDKREDAALLYWTAAAWGLAISSAKDDMKLVGELPEVEALMHRALELDENFDEGSIHEFYITWDGSRSDSDHAARAKKHYLRAVELAHGKKLSPHVTYVEAVVIPAQDKKEFNRILEEVARFDVDSDRDHRLVNIVSQRRARWLLSRSDELLAE